MQITPNPNFYDVSLGECGCGGKAVRRKLLHRCLVPLPHAHEDQNDTQYEKEDPAAFPAEPLAEGGSVRGTQPVPVLLDPGNECCVIVVHVCCLLYDGAVEAM